jgi:hypothetical protein
MELLAVHFFRHLDGQLSLAGESRVGQNARLDDRILSYLKNLKRT